MTRCKSSVVCPFSLLELLILENNSLDCSMSCRSRLLICVRCIPVGEIVSSVRIAASTTFALNSLEYYMHFLLMIMTLSLTTCRFCSTTSHGESQVKFTNTYPDCYYTYPKKETCAKRMFLFLIFRKNYTDRYSVIHEVYVLGQFVDKPPATVFFCSSQFKNSNILESYFGSRVQKI